jgi:hypothetical protein
MCEKIWEFLKWPPFSSRRVQITKWQDFNECWYNLAI